MGLLDRLRKIQSEKQSGLDLTKPRPIPEIADIIDGKRYSSLDAKCIAQGPMTAMFVFPAWHWLMQTNKNNFFVIQELLGQQFPITITPIDRELRLKWFQTLKFHEVPFERAFPDVDVNDA